MKITYRNKDYEVFLGDDGTLDTLVIVDNIEHRFNLDDYEGIRDDEGNMTYEGLKELAEQAIEACEIHW